MGRWGLKLLLSGIFSVGLALFLRSEAFDTFVVSPLMGAEAADRDPQGALRAALIKLKTQPRASEEILSSSAEQASIEPVSPLRVPGTLRDNTVPTVVQVNRIGSDGAQHRTVRVGG